MAHPMASCTASQVLTTTLACLLPSCSCAGTLCGSLYPNVMQAAYYAAPASKNGILAIGEAVDCCMHASGPPRVGSKWPVVFPRRMSQSTACLKAQHVWREQPLARPTCQRPLLSKRHLSERCVAFWIDERRRDGKPSQEHVHGLAERRESQQRARHLR